MAHSTSSGRWVRDRLTAVQSGIETAAPGTHLGLRRFLPVLRTGAQAVRRCAHAARTVQDSIMPFEMPSSQMRPKPDAIQSKKEWLVRAAPHIRRLGRLPGEDTGRRLVASRICRARRGARLCRVVRNASEPHSGGCRCPRIGFRMVREAQEGSHSNSKVMHRGRLQVCPDDP